MNLAEIEAELEKLTADELRHLALKTWMVFVQKEGQTSAQECDEMDLKLLAALDAAIAKADDHPEEAYSGNQVRERLRQWSSK